MKLTLALTVTIFVAVIAMAYGDEPTQYIVGSSGSNLVAQAAPRADATDVCVGLDATVIPILRQAEKLLEMRQEIRGTPAADGQGFKDAENQFDLSFSSLMTSGQVIFVKPGTPLKDSRVVSDNVVEGTVEIGNGQTETVYVDQGDLSDEPGAANAAAIKPEDTRQFFTLFCAKAQPPKRDPFETDQEYTSSLPPPWESSRIVYFEVMPGEGVTIENPDAENGFSYDIHTQTLTITSGSAADSSDGGWHPKATRPIQLLESVDSIDSYKATNGFGAQVSVTRESATDCVLYVHGMEACPRDIFDSKTCQFKVSTNLPPDQAKAETPDLRIIIGVRLRSYANSYYGLTCKQSPTFSDPVDITKYRMSIEADFVSVSLMDSTSGKILTQFDVPAGHA